jgi:hypothetical protein
MTAPEPRIWTEPSGSAEDQFTVLITRRAEAMARVAIADREIRDANDRKRRAHEIWRATDARILVLCASEAWPLPSLLPPLRNDDES